MTTHYETLGINKNATEDEIKKAYRRAAAKYHPDREGGDTAKFQEVQTAYETLSDATKRQQYDNPQQPQNHFQGFNFHPGAEDIFSSFFRHTGQPKQQQRRNKDLRVNLSITLESTLEAQKKSIDVQTTTGEHFVVDLDIPRGVNNGATIKYTQMGDNFFGSLTRGDLYVIITILPHERFVVNGINLITSIEISAVEAMLGVEKNIIGLDNKEFAIKIPEGCQHGTKFAMSKQGLFQMNVPFRGDLILDVHVHVPVPTAEQREALKNIFNIKE